MSYPPVPPGGTPEWQSQQPEWQGQPPGWQGQPPEWQGQPGWQGQPPEWQSQPGWQGQPPEWQSQPGWQSQQLAYGGHPEPDNYLVWAILVTVLCCLPFGIVSIVYSTKVSGLWSQGRYAEAQAASANAKKWAIIGAITGAVIVAVSMVLYILLIVVAVSNTPSVTTTTYSGY